MAPAMTEREFNDQMEKHGFKIIRPGDPGFVTWGHVDVGDGIVADRWRGGSTLASQLAYLVSVKQASQLMRRSPPPVEPPDEPKKRAKTKKSVSKGP
jgi:hypothetical protein